MKGVRNTVGACKQHRHKHLASWLVKRLLRYLKLLYSLARARCQGCDRATTEFGQGAMHQGVPSSSRQQELNGPRDAQEGNLSQTLVD